MYGTDRIRRILDVVLSSGQVLNGTEVSACLIAGSDGGKSQLVLEHVPKNTRILNDFHYATIIPMLNEKEPPTRLIVPDFNMVLSHRPVVATLTCSMLLGLMGEGLSEIPGLDGKAKLQVDSLRSKGVRLSIITAMTPQMFRSKRGKWRDTGFLRRLMPIYYKYTSDTVDRIQNWINDSHYKINYAKNSYALPQKKNVEIPRAFLDAIKVKAEATRKDRLIWFWEQQNSGKKIAIQAVDYPFTLQKIFIAMVLSHALMEDRTRVEERDIVFLDDMRNFVRYDFPGEL